MTIYTCERCHYSTQYKGDLKKHLEKQIECLPTYSTIDTKALLDNLLQPKIYTCEHCDKSFAHSRSRSRHIHTEHPNTSTNQSHNTTTATETHTQSHNATTTHSHNPINHSHNTTHNQSHNTNCPTINIQNLNVFGQEELGHILNNEEFLTRCVRHITGKGLQEMIKSIWCNKDVPENHNVELKRERKPRLVNVFVQDDKGKRWVQKLADEVIDDMIQKGTGILQVHNNTLYRYDEDMTESDIERHDIRSEALTKIKSKSRGYAKKRDAVLVELKNHKNDLES
jgi:hypothetical protein